MNHSGFRGILGALAAAAALLCGACAHADGTRIVAVGDLHGDYAAYQAIMKDAGLIDAKGKWKGGTATLVQLGDIPDRGPDTLKIIRHLMKLEKQAKKKGGKIIPLIGNHEAMNMTGDLRYVTPGEYAAFRTKKSAAIRAQYFKTHVAAIAARYRTANPAMTDDAVKAKFEADVSLGYIEHRAAWSPKGEIGKWILTHDALAWIDRTVFVHGGLSETSAYANWSRDQINAKVRELLAAGAPGGILEDEKGPLWYRGNVTGTPEAAAEVDRLLGVWGADRMVVGHTPSLTGIKALYGGKVIQADTGASSAMGGVRSWLEIGAAGIVAHDSGKTTVITPP